LHLHPATHNRSRHSLPTRRSSDLSKSPPTSSRPSGRHTWGRSRRRTKAVQLEKPPKSPSPALREREILAVFLAALLLSSCGFSRSEEHTSELQSLTNHAFPLLLDK